MSRPNRIEIDLLAASMRFKERRHNALKDAGLGCHDAGVERRRRRPWRRRAKRTRPSRAASHEASSR